MKKQLLFLFLILIVSIQSKSQTGAALNFDGVNDNITVGNNSSLNNLAPSRFTMEAWINPSQLSGSGAYSIIRKPGDYNLFLIFGRLWAEIWTAGTSSSTWKQVQGSTPVALNAWTHVAAVWNGTTCVLYQNGVVDPAAVNNGNIGVSAGLSIGSNGTSAEFFKGSLDEVRIWNVVRTQCEINTYKNCEIPTTTSGLVANYHFNQGVDAGNNSTITTLTDVSGNSNTGTLGNFALNGSISNWITPGGVVSGFTTAVISSFCTPAAALNFDGGNDRVNLGNGITNSLAGSTKVSVEAWVRPTSLSGLGCIIGNYRTTSAALQILLRRSSSGFYEFWIGNGGSWYNTNSVATPTLNVWQHVAATWDGTEASIYVNGVLSGKTTPPLSTLGNASGNAVWLGGNTINESFTGDIDEVRIWNVERTQCDIISNMNCEIASATPGLLANYHFNQGYDLFNNSTVTTLTDVSGNSNTGTLTNFALTGSTSNWVAPGGVTTGSTTPSACTLASALNFDGTNDFVAISSSAALSMTNAITIESWVKTTGSPTGEQYIMSKSDDSYYMALNVGGNLGRASFYINGVSSGWLYTTSTNINDNNWHHIAATYDGAMIKIYVDGVLENSVVASGSILTGFNNVNLGCRNSNLFLQGSLDEVRIWNLPRTQCQINTYMSSEIPSSLPGLVGNYHFNQGVIPNSNSTVTMLNDASGNSNNGTLNNFALTGATSNWVAPGAVVSGFTTTSTSAFCPPAEALNLDGIDDFVDLGTPANLPIGNSAYTIEAKIKPTVLGVEGIVGWGNYGNTGQSNALRLDGSGNIINYWWGPDLVVSSAPINLLDGNWHHIAATFDGTTRSIFVDGILKGSDNPGSSHTVPAMNVRIGSTCTLCGGEFFNGGIDEVRIWNVGRTQCDVISYMNCEIPSTATGLVANYHFNQGLDGTNNATVTTLTDASGNSNNGTLTNLSLSGATSNWIAPGGVITGSITPAVCNLAAALDFDGSDDHVRLSDNNSLDFGSGDFTIESWVNKKVSSSGYLNTGGINKWNNGGVSGTNEWLLSLTNSGNDDVPAFWIESGTTIYQCAAVTPLTLNTWAHIAAVKEGTNMKIYVNGILENTINIGNVSVNNVGRDLLIGAIENGYFANMNADNTRIWNVARTQCDISTYMNAEIPGSATGLVVNYNFNQGVDAFNNSIVTSVMDASGNSNNGMLNNFALNGATSNWIAPGAVVSGYTTTLAPSTITVNSGTICAGQSFTMIPSGANTYTYSNGSDVVMPTTDATYTVSGTALTGCPAIDAVSSVTVNTLPILTVNSGAICAGQSFTMMPSGAVTYTYSNGSDVAMPTADASYTVTGTDANGCENMATSSVTVNALPTITVNDGTVCAGQSFTMTPSGAVTYTYSNGSDVAMPTADATYTVMGTDANGCQNTAAASVTVNALPTISVNSGVICAGQSFTMVPSGATTYTYSSGTDVVMPTSDATYSVSGTDANGCENMATSSVTVNALPVLSATSTSTLMCTGETATLTVIGALTYTWSTTETTMNIVVTPSVQTTYTVDGIDANGCMNTTTITQDVSLCTGLANNSTSPNLLSIFPNPSNGMFTIKSEVNMTLSLTNDLGQVLQTIKLDGFNDRTLTLENIANGMYFISGQNGNQSVKQKIVVMR